MTRPHSPHQIIEKISDNKTKLRKFLKWCGYIGLVGTACWATREIAATAKSVDHSITVIHEIVNNPEATRLVSSNLAVFREAELASLSRLDLESRGRDGEMLAAIKTNMSVLQLVQKRQEKVIEFINAQTNYPKMEWPYRAGDWTNRVADSYRSAWVTK